MLGCCGKCYAACEPLSSNKCQCRYAKHKFSVIITLFVHQRALLLVISTISRAQRCISVQITVTSDLQTFFGIEGAAVNWPI